MEPGTRPTLTVVVPLGPGEQAWRELLPELAALAPVAELLVVPARAEDAPEQEIEALGARRLLASPGRARQQNAGGKAANGEWLWFLHADSRLGPGALPALARALGIPNGSV